MVIKGEVDSPHYALGLTRAHMTGLRSTGPAGTRGSLVGSRRWLTGLGRLSRARMLAGVDRPSRVRTHARGC